MDLLLISKALFSLILVLLLIVLVAYLLKKFNDKNFFKGLGKDFKIKRIVPIDTKRRIVNFEFQNITYTILIGNNEILLDKQNVKKSK